MSDAIGRRHGMSRGHLQPLRVLVEHRVDDVDEGLVAVEHAVAAGEQVALQPALALVLGEHLHDPALRRLVLVGRAGSRPSNWRSVTSNTAPSRFDAVSSGPNMRKSRGCGPMTSRRNVPSTRVASRDRGAGGGDVHRVVAEVGEREVAQEQRRRWRAGSRSSAGSPWAAARRAPGPGRRPRRTAPRGGSCAATPRGARGAPAFVRTSPIGTWCERQVPSDGLPSTSFGPGPALGRPEHDHRPARALGDAALAGRPLDRVDLLDRPRPCVGRQLLVDVGRVVALDEVRARARSPP